MKHTVFIFAIVRVKVLDIEANSQVEAIKKAEAQVDLNFLGTPYLPHEVEHVEYADDIDCFEVDEEKDSEFEKSRWYDKHYKPMSRREIIKMGRSQHKAV